MADEWRDIGLDAPPKDGLSYVDLWVVYRHKTELGFRIPDCVWLNERWVFEDGDCECEAESEFRIATHWKQDRRFLGPKIA